MLIVTAVPALTVGESRSLFSCQRLSHWTVSAAAWRSASVLMLGSTRRLTHCWFLWCSRSTAGGSAEQIKSCFAGTVDLESPAGWWFFGRPPAAAASESCWPAAALPLAPLRSAACMTGKWICMFNIFSVVRKTQRCTKTQGADSAYGSVVWQPKSFN